MLEIRNVECAVWQRSEGSVFDIIQFNSDNTICTITGTSVLCMLFCGNFDVNRQHDVKC